MGHFENNLALLDRRQPELARHLRATTGDLIEILPSRAGLPTARYQRGPAETVYLHSQHNPLQDARQSLKKFDLAGADYFVFLGFGLGYGVDALLEQVNEGSCRIFVVESDLQILKAAMAARDLTFLLSLPHIHFAWPPTGVELAEQWQQFFDPVQAQKNVFITHAPALALNPPLFKSAVEIIQSQTFQIFTDINTLVGKSHTFLDNFVQNFRRVLPAPGVSNFKDRFPNIPAIIVAAGPSLDRNIHELRGIEDRALVLAADTALKPLLSNKIEPHFVLTADPTHENYLHLKGANAERAFLVGEPTAYPSAFTEFEGRIVACTFENSSLCSLSDLLGPKGTLRAWGSVATMVLDFAVLMGCNPIIFVGQDLAHSDGRTYCSGVYFEEEWFAGILDPGEWEARWTSLRSGKRVLTVQDIFGRPVESTDKLVAYWNWFAKELRSHPGVRFINATEGGILKSDVEVMSLREALYRFCRADGKLRHQVEELYGSAHTSQSHSAAVLERLKLESVELGRLLERSIGLCSKPASRTPSEFIEQLEFLKESIYASRHLAPLVDSFNQLGNVIFLRRRAGLDRLPQGSPLLAEIQNTYRDYFVSVKQALRKIEEALHQIELFVSSGAPC